MRLQQCGTDLMPGIEFGKQLFQSGDDGEMMMMTEMLVRSDPPSPHMTIMIMLVITMMVMMMTEKMNH